MTATAIEKRRRYSGYRPSGVEWLGEIPLHWETRRLKYVSSVNDDVLGENTDPDFEMLYVDISSVDSVSGIQNKELMRFENAPSRARRQTRNGDVIISTVRTYLRAIAPIVEPEPNLTVSTGFAVIRPKRGLDGPFAAYALRAPYFVDSVVARSVGVSYPAINASDLVNLSIALPPLSEQRAIAAFLDRETTRIDALIAKKERQIELLKEKRSALISHVVTKGLTPKVKKKDSGIEWLGEIPEHWEVMRFKFLLTEPLKYGANEVAELDDPKLPRYVRITDVNEDGTLRADTFKSLPEEIANPYLLKEGDLLFARSGATVGKTSLYQKSWGRAAYAGYMIRARVAPTMMQPKLAAYFARSNNYWNWLYSSVIQATIQNVSAEKYAGLILAVPPHDEQAIIIKYLDHVTARIDSLATKIRKSIEKLREYRTALISASVTGKIDVRAT